MKTVRLAGNAGVSVPALGLGTWRLGESTRRRGAEVAALRRAFELGYRLIDTAEMYGEGGAEQVVGQALAEAIEAGDLRRDEVFIVTKVYPHNASARGVAQACDRSRTRLRLDVIDLYLLHWRGAHPLADAVAAASGCLLVTADHGNADDKVERNKEGQPLMSDDGEPQLRTAHSLNPVMFAVRDSAGSPIHLRDDLPTAGLANVAATILQLLDLDVPSDYEPSLLHAPTH